MQYPRVSSVVPHQLASRIQRWVQAGGLPLLCLFLVGLVASHSIWTVSADQPPLSGAVITSVSVKNGKLQIKGQNFATSDKIEVDGTALDDTKARKNKPSAVLTAVSGGNLATGTYVVTVRSVSGSRSAPFLFDNKVSNGSPRVTIKVEPPSLQVVKSEQIQLTAKALDAVGGELAGVTYVWSVSNPAIASVDETGKVTGLATGQVTVSAVALRTTGLSTIDVTDIQTGSPGVQILTSDLVVNEGQTLSLTAIVRDEAGQPIPDAVVTWESDSPEIATVDTTGRIQGIERGFATITARSENTTRNASASVTLSVVRVESNSSGTSSTTGSVTLDSSNRVYQTDLVRQVVRRGPFGQALELYAGLTDKPGKLDGARTAALFHGPLGITIDNRQGNVYVADSINNAIRCIGQNDQVTTFTGKDQPGSTDGTLAEAQFRNPRGVLVDEAGNIFIADTDNHTIRFINTKKGTVTTLAGVAGQAGNQDGVGGGARFNKPEGLALDTSGKNIVVADTGNNTVRLISRKGEVLTLGPLARPAQGARSRTKNQPTQPASGFLFNAPKAVNVDALGNIYVAETTGVKVILRQRRAYTSVINLAQTNTFGKADCVSVLGSNIYVLDAGSTAQNLKRVTVGTPEIQNVDPEFSALAGGGTVNVRGRNFAPETTVLLDGQQVTDLKVKSATRLEFTVPPAIASGLRNLTVQHRGGIDQFPFYYIPPDLNQITPGDITTLAGGNQFAGDGGLATRAVLADPRSITIDALGNAFFTDTVFNRIRRIDSQSRIITTVAGTGRIGFNGDNRLATEADLNLPESIAADEIGNLYIADRFNGRVRFVDATTNQITTLAGGGNPADGIGDGPAPGARLEPRALALDRQGNLYIADQSSLRIRKLNLLTGIISTVAGGGTPSDEIGDGGSPLAAKFNDLSILIIDRQGRLLVGDTSARRIRLIDFQTNTIQTLNLPFLGTQMAVQGLELDPEGRLLVGTNGRAFRINLETGTGEQLQIPGDRLGNIRDMTADGFGNIFVADDGDFGVDRGPGRILRVDPLGTKAQVYAGGGDSVRDGRLAAAAYLRPNATVLGRGGELFISDGFNNRIRETAPLLNTISTFAGGGKSKDTSLIGDGGPATEAVLREPQGLVVDPQNNLLIADSGNRRIRIVTSDGKITTIAGTGDIGSGGDEGPALRAQFSSPSGLALDVRGQMLYVVDAGLTGSRIRIINLRNGIITTLIGTTPPGFSGDNGPARQAQISRVYSAALDGEGNLYFADSANHRIRRIDGRTRAITTVAGSGSIGVSGGGFSGDGGSAKQALLKSPTAVALDADGNLFIADTGNLRIRRVDARTGVITTIAGTGEMGFDGDGKPATTAKLGIIFHLQLDNRGILYASDVLFNVVRAVRGAGATGIGTGTGPE